MNTKILKMAGFSESVDLFEKGECVFCKKEIKFSDFRDKLSRQEYEISGMCQACQDEMFG